MAVTNQRNPFSMPSDRERREVLVAFLPAAIVHVISGYEISDEENFLLDKFTEIKKLFSTYSTAVWHVEELRAASFPKWEMQLKGKKIAKAYRKKDSINLSVRNELLLFIRLAQKYISDGGSMKIHGGNLSTLLSLYRGQIGGDLE